MNVYITIYCAIRVQYKGAGMADARRSENPDGPFPERHVTRLRCRRMWAAFLNDPGIEFRTNYCNNNTWLVQCYTCGGHFTASAILVSSWVPYYYTL